MKLLIGRTIKKYSDRINLDFDYLIQNSFWTSLILILDVILGFVFTTLLVRYLAPIDLGRWYWFVSLFSFISIFTLPGFNIISKKSFIEGFYSSYKKILTMRLIFSLIGTIGSIIIGFSLRSVYPNLFIYFLLMGILLLFSNNRLYLDYLYSKNEFRKIAILAAFKYFIYYLSSIYMILSGKSLFSIILVFFVTQYLYDLLLTIFFYYIISSRENLNKIDLSINLGFKFTFLQFFVLCSRHVDKLLIPVLLDLETLAIYGIILIIPNALNNLQKKFINSLVFKKLKNISLKELKLLFANHYTAITCFSVLLFLVFGLLDFVYLKYILNKHTSFIFFSSLYLLVLNFFDAGTDMFRFELEGKGLIDKITTVDIKSSFMMIVSNLVLINLLGILGAIMSKTLLTIYRFKLYVFD